MLLPITAMLAVIVPVAPALGQSSSQLMGGAATTQLWIDAPTSGASVRSQDKVDVGGWSFDTAGPGTGVDQVRVYLDGTMDSGTYLGTATYGKPRPDVGTSFNSAALNNTGYDYVWTPGSTSAGNHTLYVYTHSIANGWAYKTVTVSVSAQPTPGPSGYQNNYNQRYGPPGYGGYPPYNQYPPYQPYPPYQQYPPYQPYPPYPYQPYPGSLPAPGNLAVTGITGTTVTLTWTPVTGATSYRVYQAVLGGAFVQAAATFPTPTTAMVTGLLPNTTYRFQVVAVDATGNQGPPSTPISLTTTPGP
jgi:hypothetical protein